MSDILRPLDKPFGGFPPNPLNPTMHAPVPTYGASLGGSFCPPGGPHMNGSSGLGYGGLSNAYNNFPSSLQSSMASSFSSIPSITAGGGLSSGLSSGLNLSTTSNMVGAMA